MRQHVQSAAFLVEQVLESARSAHDNVGALRVEGSYVLFQLVTAHEQDDLELAQLRKKGANHLEDLRSELAGRRDNQGADIVFLVVELARLLEQDL